MMKKSEKSASYSHILKYTGLFGGVQGLCILVGVIRNKLVAMILGPEGVGLISLFNSTIRFLGDSTNLGLPMSAVKNISEAYDQKDDRRVSELVRIIRSWCVMTALLGMVLCIVLSPLLSKWTFSWDGHTLHFICLSPTIALLAVYGGELAILKGVRRLGALARIQVYTVFFALLVTTPLYYIYRSAAIVPSLLLVALAQLVVTVWFSYRQFPLQLSFRWSLIGKGTGIVKLGLAFVLAEMMGSGAEFIIRSMLNSVADVETLGLYNAGFMMTMTYGGMIFSAMETDYFPRLSAITEVGPRLNETVNMQIEVSLLMLAPLLVIFMVGLPIWLPLLYTGKFLPAIGMIQLMILAMYLRAVKLPLAYLPLARGDSRSYLLMEGLYAVLQVIIVTASFRRGGLVGVGVGILVIAFLDYLILNAYMFWRYEYRVSVEVVRVIALQFPIALASYALTFISNPWIYWGGGFVMILLSAVISVSILRRKTSLWSALKARFLRKTPIDE